VLRVKDVDAAAVGVSVAVKLQCTWPLKLKLKRSDCDGTAGSLSPFIEPTNNIYMSYNDVFDTFLLYTQVAPSEHCSNMSPNLVKAQIRGARTSVSRISSPGCIPSPTYLPAPPYSVLSAQPLRIATLRPVHLGSHKTYGTTRSDCLERLLMYPMPVHEHSNPSLATT
jgi:hypothetical protein